jgi:ABC-2 family transporter protein
VLIVLATMFITAEYRRGLIRTTLAATPRRGRVLLAKASVIGAVTFVAGAVACAVSIAIGNHILRTNGNYVYPASTLTELRVVLGTAALLALVAVLSLAVGTMLRRSAGAITAVIALIILPYILATASALPPGPSDWLLRLTPAAGFAIEQTLPQYHQVSYLYDPTGGFYPLAPGFGLAVLGAYTVVALLIARRLAVQAISGEYSCGMIRITLIAIPRRPVVLGAKAAIVAVLVLVAGAIAVLGSVLAGRLILPAGGFTTAHGYAPLSLGHGATLRAAGGSVLYLALIALLSLGVAAAVREAAVAIGIVLGLFYVFPVIAALIGDPHVQRHLEQIAPMSAGLAIRARSTSATCRSHRGRGWACSRPGRPPRSSPAAWR